MAVVEPLKFVLANLPEGHAETLSFPNHPKDESLGTREVPFSRELWIERGDFAEVPPKGWKRLVPGGRSEEHTSELQSLMRISYAVFCLKQKYSLLLNIHTNTHTLHVTHTKPTLSIHPTQ